MTNTKLLKECIRRSGLKINFIASEMGISRAALSNKIHNRSEFSQREIEKVCDLLSIRVLETKEAVFLLRCRRKHQHLTTRQGGSNP